MSAGDNDNRTQGSRADVQQRKADVVRLKRQGVPFRKIADELGISYSYAYELYWKAMAEIPAPAVAAMRAHITEMMTETYEVVRSIRDGVHYAHSGSELIYPPHSSGEDRPEPLKDSGPVLAASRELRKIADTLARVHGANAPTQVSVAGEVAFTINGVDTSAMQ